MDSMAQKGQWMVLPYAVIKEHPGLQVIPIRVVPQHDRRPQTIVDYTFSDINKETQLLAPKEAIQFGKALTCILAKIMHTDAWHGPVKLIKVNAANGFYCVHLAPGLIRSLGISTSLYFLMVALAKNLQDHMRQSTCLPLK
jgi:hypothetical protein